MPFKTVTIVAIACLALTGNAYGRHHRPRNPVARAQSIATAFWGAAPCKGHITVRAEEITEQHEQEIRGAAGIPEQQVGLSMSVEAISEWQTPEGRDTKTPPPDTYTSCTVIFNIEAWGTWREDNESFPVFCTIMVHEYGNLFGLREENEPGADNIMSAGYDGTAAGCD